MTGDEEHQSGASVEDLETVAERARRIRAAMPAGGLFAEQEWRIATAPFVLGKELARELETLGRVLIQFNKAANLLYRRSAEGKEPAWVAEWLDRGKPEPLIAWQRDPAFKNDLPRVIRPDLLLTESGLFLTELDSVPGGIGLTGWLSRTYAEQGFESVLGGAEGMIEGFGGIFGASGRAHVVVSDESATYRPEMEWICGHLGARFQVRDTRFRDWSEGDSVYRFFELFDLKQVENAAAIVAAAREGILRATPPFKPLFEEKLLFALLWNRNLRAFWRRELGESFQKRMERLVPYTWMMDPAPLPPQGAIPELNLTDWHQLKTLSQRERELILKVSGYSENAWGARGVHLGSDLPVDQWSEAVDAALREAGEHPRVLQRYQKPRLIGTEWFDFDSGEAKPMRGRVRLCPYYFVIGDGDSARAHLGGVLATICPADKKIIHGMRDAVLAPCVA